MKRDTLAEVGLAQVRRKATLVYSRWNRQRKIAFALRFARERDVRTVLIVGVSRFKSPTENAIEEQLIAVGFDVVATGIAYELKDPEFDPPTRWPNYIVADGRKLPFADASFDLVYSNAVLEHVGQEPEQRAFVQEHARVGRHFIITTPNRWFPIESHTDVLFKHWRSEWLDEYGSVTRLIGPRAVAALLPSGGRVHGTITSPTLTATSA